MVCLKIDLERFHIFTNVQMLNISNCQKLLLIETREKGLKNRTDIVHLKLMN